MEDIDLPERIFAAGEEPLGHHVNSYHKTKRINWILNPLDENEREALRQSPFGKLIATSEKPSYSGSFGQYIITRLLDVKKKHEIWILFAGRPIRVSLREFAIVTGLSCAKFPKRNKKKKKQNIKEKPYWPALFGNLQSCTVDLATKMLRKKAVTGKDIRFKYTCLCITAGVLFPTSHIPKIVKEHVELIRDINEFFAYPWGRLAFDMLMSSIKEKDALVFSQSSLVVKGFCHAVQLVMVEAVPSLTEVVQLNDTSSSESGSDVEAEEGTEAEAKAEDGERLLRTEATKLSLSPAHARDIDVACKAVVDCIISDNGETGVDEMDLGWSDEEVDEKVDNMVKLIREEFEFKKHMFKGGLTPADLTRMRREKKDKELKLKKEKDKLVDRNEEPGANVVDVGGASIHNDTARIAEMVASKIRVDVENVAAKVSLVLEKVKIIEDAVKCFEKKMIASLDSKLHAMQGAVVEKIIGFLEKSVSNVAAEKDVFDIQDRDAGIATGKRKLSGGSVIRQSKLGSSTYAEATDVIDGVLGAINRSVVEEVITIYIHAQSV